MTSPREPPRPASPDPQPGATSDTAASLEPVAPTATTAVGLEPVADTAQTAAALAPVATDQTAAALPPVGNDRTAAVLPKVAASPDPRALYLKWGPLGALLAVAVLGLGLYLLDSGSGGSREGMADLVLSSTPAGATVVIDGRSLPGRTPVTVRDLPTDRPHLAIVELPGYQRWSQHLKLTPGTPNTLHALLQPAQP